MSQDLKPLEAFRSFLCLQARLHLDPGCQKKLDASDIVQQTLLRAVQAQGQFQGTTDAERAAWLQQILANTMANALRDLHRDKRDANRERSLEASLAQSSARLADWLKADQSSPSQKAQAYEERLQLAAALEQLPEAQREALERHYLKGESLAQVGASLGRTPASVAGLLQRGLRQLRVLLKESE